jgi:cell division protein FtsI (penicillin-binding protein 3)
MRFVLLAGIFLFWVGVIAVRLVWLQVFEHATYVERASRQQERTFEVAPRRGVLYDRNLQELAMTVLADSIYAVPSEITDKEDTARQLARIVHVDPSDTFTAAKAIDERLENFRNFAWVARKVTPEEAARVASLNLKGIYDQKEFKRYYPDNRLAAQVLGYVSLDDNGLGGIEHRYDTVLHGTPGRMLTAVDARQHSFGSVERDPQPGENLVLTIDANIQFLAEQALEHAMERTKPLNGTVVVQDPHTGQILALAIRPTFDPNDFRHATSSLLLNHAVSDVYEPGSTFKLVTYSAALQEKVATPTSMIPTLGGQINVAGRIVHDDRDAINYESHYHNVLSATQALEQSSDVAAITLAERMGKDRFYSYIRAFGFGQKSGIELPGETRGLLKPPNRWQPTTIGSIPMGQEIAVTPIQLVTMASTIANGGMYLPPHIVLEKTPDFKGNPLLVPAAFHPEDNTPETLPAGAHRVISTMTAAEMRRMMEGVVLFGTGTTAQLNGYSAAGKTGTAQKIDVRTHTYSKTKYIASFVGFAPVNNPAITIAVIIDSPSVGSHFGRGVSAPVFQELAQKILEYLGVPHDEPIKSTREMAAIANRPAADDAPEAHPDDLNSLFEEVNDLPADDPLRQSAKTASGNAGGQSAVADTDTTDGASGYGVSAGRSAGTQQQAAVAATDKLKASKPDKTLNMPGAAAPTAVEVRAGDSITVPSFVGQPMRQAVERATSLGLGVQVLGSGIARQQAPAAGTRVPPGTQVVLRFAR